MWGQEILKNLGYATARIIPTRVGTRQAPIVDLFSARDHPHACGDKLSTRESGMLGEGSSPRVWGQVFFGLCLLGLVGIIPTRVGTSGDMMVKAALH